MIKLTLHIVYGEDFVSFYEEHNLIPEEYATEESFDTEIEKDAFMRGVTQSRDTTSYSFVTDYENHVLHELSGMRGYFNIGTGNTYQIEDVLGEPMPDMTQEPVHLNDIEISDWWLSLTDEDWELINKYDTKYAIQYGRQVS